MLVNEDQGALIKERKDMGENSKTFSNKKLKINCEYLNYINIQK